VYSPGNGEKHPVVVWIHGGGWTKGDKGGLKQKPQAFADRGYVLVSINYRLLPEVSVRVMMADVAKALRWIRDHATEHRGDPDSIAVMGHSAGAHLAALVCTDHRYCDAEGVPASCLKGCVPVDVSAYDIPKRIKDLEDGISANFRTVFGSDEATQRDLSPVNHVHEGSTIPPFLILHVASRADTREQAHRFKSALTKAGFPARVFAAEGKTHGSIGADIGMEGDAPSDEIWKFFESVFKRK
jgi:acetyl esterase/lipase